MAYIEKKIEEGINEINIIPFVDIVLVLLIIFMISTPAMIYQGIILSLPTAMNSEDISHITIKLSIDKNGNYYIDGKKSTISEIREALSILNKEKIFTDALISADKEVKHGVVMELSDILKSYGIKRIGLSTKTSIGSQKAN